MTGRRGLLDTGPLVAYLDAADHHYSWSVETLERFDTPLSTCDAVIAEAWFLLGRVRHGRRSLLALLDTGEVNVSFGLATESAAAYKLMHKYADQPMSVADACLVRMAELDADATLITLDSDFRVYRRGRAQLRVAAPWS